MGHRGSYGTDDQGAYVVLRCRIASCDDHISVRGDMDPVDLILAALDLAGDSGWYIGRHRRGIKCPRHRPVWGGYGQATKTTGGPRQSSEASESQR